MWQCSYTHIALFWRYDVAPEGARVPLLNARVEDANYVIPPGFAHSTDQLEFEELTGFLVFSTVVILALLNIFCFLQHIWSFGDVSQ